MAIPAPTSASARAQILAELSRTSCALWAAWAIIAAISGLVLLLAALAGLRIVWHDFWTAPALGIAVSVTGLLLRVSGRLPRLADIADAAGAIGLLAFCVPLLTCILARTALPLADARLIALDAALGFDWLALVSRLKTQEMPSLALCYAYASLMHQPAILILVLGLAGRADRLQSFVLAWAAALAITVLIFPLLPAVGGYLHYGLTPRDFPFIKVPAPFMYGKVLMAFRDGSALALDRLALEGIVAFPSFHTAAGILLAWGFWVVRWVRWPALALNGAMIASCPFVGAHYLIDIVAGGLVAWAAIILARRIDTPPRTAGSPLDFLKRLASQRAWRFAARRASRDRAYRASSPAPAR